MVMTMRLNRCIQRDQLALLNVFFLCHKSCAHSLLVLKTMNIAKYMLSPQDNPPGYLTDS